jgi:hypothetical protein
LFRRRVSAANHPAPPEWAFHFCGAVGIVPEIRWSTSIPHVLILWFLGIVATTAGTIVFEETMKHTCLTGFMIVAGVSGFL